MHSNVKDCLVMIKLMWRNETLFDSVYAIFASIHFERYLDVSRPIDMDSVGGPLYDATGEERYI